MERGGNRGHARRQRTVDVQLFIKAPLMECQRNRLPPSPERRIGKFSLWNLMSSPIILATSRSLPASTIR